MAWPRAGEMLTSAYRQDSASAAASRGAFATALATAHAATGGARLMLIAHSLGGQFVGESFRQDSALRRLLRDDPLRAMVFVSPDDRVLFFSEWVNAGERAAAAYAGHCDARHTRDRGDDAERRAIAGAE